MYAHIFVTEEKPEKAACRRAIICRAHTGKAEAFAPFAAYREFYWCCTEAV
jgi:hypothetical protein